jgi:hypothetical protein
MFAMGRMLPASPELVFRLTKVTRPRAVVLPIHVKPELDCEFALHSVDIQDCEVSNFDQDV